jgi:probable rRNA maturation factor
MNDRPRARRTAPPATSSQAGTIRPTLSLSVRIQAKSWRSLPDLRPLIDAAANAAVAVCPVQPLDGAELSLLLTDDRRIRIVNRDWRGLDKATNVLSFPAAPPDRIAQSPALGDIVLAYETVAREAGTEGRSIENHLSHLVIHGLLHLLGQDHETDADADRMEALEIAALASLSIADPYADSEPLDVTPVFSKAS